MKIKVLGIEARSGISKKTGNPYDGYFLYYAHEQDGVIGMKCNDTFMSKEFAEPKLKAIGGEDKLVAKSVVLDFDQRGYLIGFEVL